MIDPQTFLKNLQFDPVFSELRFHDEFGITRRAVYRIENVLPLENRIQIRAKIIRWITENASEDSRPFFVQVEDAALDLSHLPSPFYKVFLNEHISFERVPEGY